MDFEDFLLSFIKHVKPDDVHDILPLLLVNNVIDEDDILDAPSDWLQKNCDVIAEGEGFSVFKERKTKDGKNRLFIIGEEDDVMYCLQQTFRIIATEEVPVGEYGEISVNPDAHSAPYSEILLNSQHMNMDGDTVVTYAWFDID